MESKLSAELVQSDIHVHENLSEAECNLVSKEKIPQCYYPAEHKELARMLFCYVLV